MGLLGWDCSAESPSVGAYFGAEVELCGGEELIRLKALKLFNGNGDLGGTRIEEGEEFFF